MAHPFCCLIIIPRLRRCRRWGITRSQICRWGNGGNGYTCQLDRWQTVRINWDNLYLLWVSWQGIAFHVCKMNAYRLRVYPWLMRKVVVSIRQCLALQSPWKRLQFRRRELYSTIHPAAISIVPTLVSLICSITG